MILKVFIILLCLLQTQTAQYQLKNSSGPIVTTVGEDVILPCKLNPERDVNGLEWSRPDLDPRFVYVWRDSKEDLTVPKNPQYVNRTFLFKDELKRGNISLKLTQVKPMDSGTYRCFIPTLWIDSNVTLIVGVSSLVSVSSLPGSSSRSSVELLCWSGGWYPKPELSWWDSERRLSAEHPQTHRHPDGLYNISSRLTVERSTNITCRVSQNVTKHSNSSSIEVVVPVSDVSSRSVAWTLFSLGVLLLLLIPVAFFVWKFKFRKSKEKNQDNQDEEQVPMMTLEEHSVVLNQTKHSLELTYNEQLKQSEELKQSEDLRKVEDELQFVKDMIEKLTETKMFQTSLKDKLHTTINQMTVNIEEKKQRKKMMTFGEDKRRKHICEMEKQLSEFENNFVKTEKELMKTNKIIEKTSERKDRLERDREQLMKLKLQEKSVGSVEVEEEGKVEVDLETSQEKELEKNKMIIEKTTDMKNGLERDRDEVMKKGQNPQRVQENSVGKVDQETFPEKELEKNRKMVDKMMERTYKLERDREELMKKSQKASGEV